MANWVPAVTTKLPISITAANAIMESRRCTVFRPLAGLYSLGECQRRRAEKKVPAFPFVDLYGRSGRQRRHRTWQSAAGPFASRRFLSVQNISPLFLQLFDTGVTSA